jgi:hypothetical protein
MYTPTMRNLILMTLIWAPVVSHAQSNFHIFFSEISPHKIETMEEWIEIQAVGTGSIDISQYQIGSKTFAETIPNLHATPPSSLNTDNDQVLITFPESGSVVLWWDTSPISLPNNGSTLHIKNPNQEVIDEITYPETQSGTSGGNDYADIWNRNDPNTNNLCALRYEHNHGYFSHTQGQPNHECPSDAEIVLSEASPKHIEHDFLELLIKNSDQEKTNLKYLEVKHNGTSLFHIETDYWIDADDRVVIEFNDTPFSITKKETHHVISTTKKDGLSAGSGTIEIRTHSGTGQLKTTDFVCWQDETLSQTESNRVQKFRDQNLWQGECIEIKDLIKNESIAREKTIDTNTKNDFFRHFNGSKGLPNTEHNSPPQAIIQTQGTYIQSNEALNLTGETSTDPDGDHDIQSYAWTINDVSCPVPSDGWNWTDHCDIESKRENPQNIYIHKPGEYTVTLTVTDYSGASHSTQIQITATENGINAFSHGSNTSALGTNIKKWVQKELEKTNTQTKKSTPDIPDFFSDFLNALPIEKIQTLTQSTITIPKYLQPEYTIPPLPRRKRDRFTPEQHKRIAKNVGLIFDPKYLYQ